MSAIQISLGYTCPTVELPCAFVDYYLPKCAPVYALIYIYTLRQCMGGVTSISSQDIGQTFQILETDVINAWRYWENEGLIKLETPDGGMNIIFLPVSKPEKPDSEPVKNTTPLKPAAPSGRPQYTAEELSIYRKQSRDIERLFSHAEQALGKMLTYHDMNVLFGFYDWLRLPVDVILYLLSYCAENDRRDLRYIEKAAIDWVDNNIDDVEKALTYTKTFDRDYREILRAMGQTSGYPTPSQRKYIEKWMNEYGLSAALALEACDLAAMQIGKPKFTYVDKIMEDWHKKGIRTLEDVKAEAEEHARKKAEAAKTETHETKPKTVRSNRFVNFKQRERDFAQLEKMEREYLLKRLNG